MKKVRTAVLAVALVWLLLMLRTCAVWLPLRWTHGSAERIPGTELACAYESSIALSPDDRCLVYSEYSMEPPMVFGLPWDEIFAVASVNLATITKTSHRDSVHCARDPFSYKMIGAEGPASWQGDVLLLRRCDKGGQYVALRPGQAELEPIERSAEPLSCSDCTSPASPMQSIDWPSKLANHWSFTADGSTVYYELDGVRMADVSGTDRVIVSAFSQKYLNMTTEFAHLRVSPDGHYLAYCVFYSLNVPIIPGSGWVQYLYLKNLNSGRVVRIASRFGLSNLVWSSDSRRLCFAGIRSPDWLGLLPHTGGVYVVDVHDVF